MRRHTAILMLLALAAIVWFSLAAVEARRLRPPTSARTLPSFLSVMPRPERFEIRDVGDRQYLLVVGRLPATVTLPSGPPEYVFDSSGNLLDWTADSGDDPRFVERRGSHSRGRRISEAEAVAFGTPRDSASFEIKPAAAPTRPPGAAMIQAAGISAHIIGR